MITPYDILDVPRNASDEAIKAAFYRTAKACHPDLNAGNPTAEQQLRQAVAAYQILKSPQRRAAYDLQLRSRRLALARRLAGSVVVGLVSGSSVALAVWLSVPVSHTQVESAPPAPLVLLATEWQQVEASGDPKAIWAFAVRNPDAPESALARSKLVGLIDAVEDVPLLHVLRLVATGAIAERARERLVRLGALAVAKADSVKADSAVSDAPSVHVPLQAVAGKTINEVPREEPVLQAVTVATINEVRREVPALQAVKVETVNAVSLEQPTLQAAEVEAVKAVSRADPTPREVTRRPRTVAKQRAKSRTPVAQAVSENRNTCSGACSGPPSALFGVGF
jgi:hypothetical protein